MTASAIHIAVVMDEGTRFDLVELAHASGTSTGFIQELVLEGVLSPRPDAAAFCGDDIARVRRVVRLQRDFDATVANAAVMLELLDEIERLRGQLRRFGSDADR